MDTLITLAPAAMLIGFLGSAHCIGMCGGISASLSMALPVGPGFRTRQISLLMGYNVGRIFSYMILAALLATLSTMAMHQWKALAFPLRTLAGVLLIMMGLSIGRWWQGIVGIEKVGKPFWRLVSPLSRRLVPVHGIWQAALLGMVWGWLPCGLVYSALTWSMTQASPTQAVALMGFFGLGTLPSMLLTGMAAHRVDRLRQNIHFRRIAGVLLVLYGIWTLPVVSMPIIHFLTR